MTSTLRVVTLLALAAALPSLTFADDKAAADPMAAWKPSVVKQADRDRKEIAALMKQMEDAAMKGDLETAAGFVDFPVLMVTDDSKGEAGGESWSRAQWVETMKPFYAKPTPPGTVTTGKPTIVLVSDSLAAVGSPWTMKMGPAKTVSGTSAMLLVRKNGAWKVKSVMEAGWGDMPAPTAAEPAAGAGSATK